jgi:hypothetical protein
MAKFVIKWKNRDETGQFTKLFTKKDAKEVCEYLNSNRKMFLKEYWYEEREVINYGKGR